MEQRLAAGQVPPVQVPPVQVPPVQVPPVRAVDNVDVLKAMADPTRLAILAALMKSRHDLPVMSVKELAAELGEPQTKLYRHVRQLEAAGLIKVASTRMVSGILEQRYQACQRDLTLERGFLQEHADESEVAVQALLDHYRDGFFTAFRAGQKSVADVPVDEPYRKPVLFMIDVRVSPAQAAELTRKLAEIMNDLHQEHQEHQEHGEKADPDDVQLSLLIGSFVPADPTGR